jgi:Heterokaryon incompatibility protein (HET)
MGDIYRNGVFNIAATAANDRAPGLFQTRDPTTISSFKVKMTWKNHEKDYLLARFNIWNDGIVNQELNRRGWVLQERLLSPRTIHFGTQIFWECCELQACETWPEGLPFGLSHLEYYRNRVLGSKLHPLSIDGSLKTSESLYQLWKNIVRSYMDCKLTKISDRVIALSGVAKEMQAILEDEYMAGLWRKDLLHELVWFVHHESILKIQTGHKMCGTEYRGM